MGKRRAAKVARRSRRGGAPAGKVRAVDPERGLKRSLLAGLPDAGLLEWMRDMCPICQAEGAHDGEGGSQGRFSAPEGLAGRA
jgi:hypothetical protein